jgi:2-polyprenyl-6-methoxyphenol hydroxylase-like FAD-dependent oxidoreductase
MRIAIVGGGPAGLYLARLVKRHDPASEITVYEQNQPDATFGFGVSLGGKARDQIRLLDAEVHDRLTAAMVFNNLQNIHLNGHDTLLEYGATNGAIERLDLLRILQDACGEVGVEMRHGVRIERLGDLGGYDLLVGADGVNSAVRRLHGDAFGTKMYNLTNYFAWYGVGRAMRPNALVFRRTDSGHFVGHYYAYTPSMSTFVAECDAATWRSSGFDAMSDEERRREIERIFAPELAGDPLIDNRSIWRNFPVVTNANWHVGNAVLLGDALLSAHFSIGSGTRLAMDDAGALFAALRDDGGDIPAALAGFVERRRPVRENFRQAAELSFLWYERLPEVMDQSPIDFVYDFLTRTGRVDDSRLATYCPGFLQLYRRHRAAAEPV